MQGRQSRTVPADIYRAGTFAGTETLAFRTGLNTWRTEAVSAIPRYIADSGRLMDTGPVQNYTQNASFPPLTQPYFLPPFVSNSSLH